MSLDAIAFSNRSTLCSDADVEAWTRACNLQIAHHAAPAWKLPPVPVVFVPKGKATPAGAWPIPVLDNSDQAGDLGYHGTDNRGLPYGRVFAATCIHAGVSVSSVMAHEALEAFVDPHVDRWLGGYAVEVGDPVENDSYTIRLPSWREDDERSSHPGRRVEVSNFALPAWWLAGSKGPWDFMRLATGPFTLRPGGYAVTRSGTRWGERYPEWRKWTKLADGSRTRRVIEAGSWKSPALRGEMEQLEVL